MNWGFKITAVFVSFTLLIGFLVYKSVHTKIDLVSTDYYKEELRFQQQIDGTHNANLLSAVKVIQTDSTIVIVFPAELKGAAIEGEAWFYCKTNADFDKKFPIKIDENDIMTLSKKPLLKTNYALKLKWISNNKDYYSEQPVNIQ
ncbi:MAG: hypothetical protein GTN67_06100 [Hydrotalea flava]|uniref:FixH family protein n=1 Tax=Hydrotalea TaxID=1004300 RepID=UPI000943B14B|nr:MULTISPECIES: FixH family protein [Hydrotalea]MBY0348614.1 FixH family protein [Hydrotalea flava]NIM35007.1 hypothetical protein [Hydrotalea flava]NIM37833.1 hypothetical protein [Hydrotalea flava]NIN03002.1 hypothetical protein [Hydrotalea flava]NIN14687.1 hypothetical protein [Hydrotalea flava]